jgi:hypothetical protein
VAHLYSNDPVNPDYSFTVTATQVAWIDLVGTIGKLNFPASGSLTTGAPITYTVPLTITNRGNIAVSGTASAADFKVYLHSTNATSNANDILVSNSTSTALTGLGAHKSKTVNLSVPISGTISAADYQLVIKYNTNGAIPEFNATGNTITATNDLAAAIGSITLSPSTIATASPTTFKIPVTITNNGNYNIDPHAAPVSVGLYIHNATGGPDTLISTQTTNGLRGLAVGKSASVTFTTTQTIGSGGFSFVAKVNENGAITESTLANNSASKLISYDVSAAISSTSFAANVPIISGSSTVYKIPVTITNTGTIPIAKDAAPVNVKIYAHDITAGTAGTDTLILSTTTTALRKLGVGKSVKLTLSSALPIALVTGKYAFVAKVDDNVAIPEATLSNNNPQSNQTFSATQGVYNITGNLVSSTFTNVAHDAPISGKMTILVGNAGNLTLPSTQKINIQLVAIASDDTVIPLGTISSASLAKFTPGKASTISLSKSLVSGLTAGTYLLAVQLTPTPSLTQNTVDDLLTQTSTHAAFHIVVT